MSVQRYCPLVDAVELSQMPWKAGCDMLFAQNAKGRHVNWNEMKYMSSNVTRLKAEAETLQNPFP